MINMKIKMLLISKKILIKKNIKRNKTFSGRNNTGKIVIRHRGGSKLKKNYKIVDYFKSFLNVKGLIVSFEYDSMRKTLVCLVMYVVGISSYILALEDLNIGDYIINGTPWAKKVGCSLPLKYLKFRTKISNLEINLNQGGKLIRSSGNVGIIVKKQKNFSVIKLNSGRLKRIKNNCFATVGRILNFNFFFFRYKKAGILRLKNWRPTVRGVAMNPVDHPFGGGKGKKSKKIICMSPWGKLIKGRLTRSKKKCDLVEKESILIK